MSDTGQPRTLLTIDPDESYPRNSEGAILVGGDGALLLAYTRFTGGKGDNAEAHVSLRVSSDGGATWGPDRVLVKNEGRENIMSVSLLRLPSGEILLLYLVKNGWDDCHPCVRRSPDDLHTLSGPTAVTSDDAIAYYVINNDRLIRLPSGRIVAPSASHFCGDGTRDTWDPRCWATCFLSDDEGHSWRRGHGVLSPPAECGASGLQEPGVVELEDGRLWMWMRTASGFQWQSFSQDGGETWSRPGPTTMPSPLSPMSVKRIPATGDLLAVWNDHSYIHPTPEERGKRTPLCTAVSTDEGRSWSPSRILEGDPEGWYCYTSITFEGDRVLLGYCAGNDEIGRLSRLRVTSVPINWLYA